jgi:L-alanine-DL-glutamate epimerase-like enolase superfamily enzyme
MRRQELGCIDIAQPDIAHAGGISETKKIATMAECANSLIYLARTRADEWLGRTISG